MAASDSDGPKWYFTRKEIEENSPSRKDGIDLRRETYLRRSYCAFLQNLGMRLQLLQATIATAIVFCHRFYLHQSHAKTDGKTIATSCMFLAGKSEDAPRTSRDVILVSYEIIHKNDPAAMQKIRQPEVLEQQKELLLLGERVLLTTLGYDFSVLHPYAPLVEEIKKLKIAQMSLTQVAWNFVNDGLRTTLCLQYKPNQITAAAIFLAAKFLKVKLPNDGERPWWQQLDVTPKQLEDISFQLLELYEEHRVGQRSRPNEVSTGTVTSQGHPSCVTEGGMGKRTMLTSHVQRTVRETPIAPHSAKDNGTATASIEAIGVTSSRGNWQQFHNGNCKTGAPVSQYRENTTDNNKQCSVHEVGPPSYGSINKVEYTASFVNADREASKRKHEASTAKSRWSNEPPKETVGSGWPDHAEGDTKRHRVEGHM